MARGGARPGAGRPQGAVSVKKVDPEVIAAGLLPLEMILTTARAMWAEAVDAAGKITDFAKAKEAAKFAEPALQYTSAKLSSIAHTGPAGGPVEIDVQAKIDREVDELMKMS